MQPVQDKYKEYRQLNLPEINKEILSLWSEENTFSKSLELRRTASLFTFYEGPPSANGLPGIHHVMARAIKDIFCRYKTMKGFYVERKGGWDTHGLPIELSVEKTLGITKEDIGKSITVEEYNQACRREVMKYKEAWDNLTRQMGYWVDLENPYVTFENNYIESVWNLLKQLYDKNLLYKGYTIQPYSPAAGTGLSSHELNMPGSYRTVKDTTVVAQFKIKNESAPAEKLIKQFGHWGDLFLLAWTTTPWTLPSNTALAVGKNIDYSVIQTYNPYTYKKVVVILAKETSFKYFTAESAEKALDAYKEGDKLIPFAEVATVKGADLENIRYDQLLPYAQPVDGDAFKIVLGDFVTTADGTGIVHIAPSFGADDFRTAKQNGLGSLTLVDKQGRFTDEVTDFAGEFVKEEYIKEVGPEYKTVDVRIAIKLKEENKAFRVEKYEHTYPHCWRTDKPILYYPLDSWFVKTTAMKERMIELNKTINWKPESTGTGRFGNWLENLVDWNLSRSRFWGIPLPIWTSEDKTEQICIGSIEELAVEIDKAVNAGVMKDNPVRNTDGTINNDFDLHRPYVDDLFLISVKGTKLTRESDLIDVWFDSGAMPYAQWHYPFENKDMFQKNFPADFIAEGVDQTRGWFFTLHAIAVMLFDSVAFKNVVSNGLVLDKFGNKMSKRHGNTVDPFLTIEQYGADATRWYMISNSQPWDNLKFNTEGIAEVQRKFFGTLHNTYSFFALYANIDQFTFGEEVVPLEKRTELDRWIISLLNTLIAEVDEAFQSFEPTKAARLIQTFVNDNLSNWYIRLSRRRFWKGEYSMDKIAAYQTLYNCLETLSLLMAPIAPFYSDRLFRDLNNVSGKVKGESVHLVDFPKSEKELINSELEKKMELAQQISSMVLSLRKKVNIRVRQPLNKIMIPAQDASTTLMITDVTDLILSEVNVKSLEFLMDTSGILVKRIKPNFKVLGPKVGPGMKQVAAIITQLSQDEIRDMEKHGNKSIVFDGNQIDIVSEDVEITSEDIPGWLVANEGNMTVALDVTITSDLKEEGMARDLINRIQNLRKDKEFNVTDKIQVEVQSDDTINSAIVNNLDYICSEILASSLHIKESIDIGSAVEIELEDSIKTLITIKKFENGKI
ncbi:MAG: isoleucine--tRNA ligase [Bacteroidia bacterium]